MSFFNKWKSDEDADASDNIFHSHWKEHSDAVATAHDNVYTEFVDKFINPEGPIEVESVNIVVSRRGNLKKVNKDLPFEEIELEHFIGSMKPMQVASIFMFVDDDGETKLLKNRYGNAGIVVNKRSRIRK